jgi:hypothetical protein
MSELLGRSVAPKMRSRRKGCHLCTGEVRNLEVPHSENATVRQQAQYVGKLFALPPPTSVLAELAFAGGQRQ